MTTNKNFTVLGSSVEVIAASSATAGSLCIFLETSQPGFGPPPHIHEREDEIFSVIEGEYELFDGQQWNPLRKGEYKVALRGNVHTFRNSGRTPGKLLCMATPGGLDEYLEAISPLTIPQDLQRLTEISDGYGIKFVAPEPAGASLY